MTAPESQEGGVSVEVRCRGKVIVKSGATISLFLSFIHPLIHPLPLPPVLHPDPLS